MTNHDIPSGYDDGDLLVCVNEPPALKFENQDSISDVKVIHAQHLVLTGNRDEHQGVLEQTIADFGNDARALSSHAERCM